LFFKYLTFLFITISVIISGGRFVKGIIQIVKNPSDYYLISVPKELLSVLLTIKEKTPKEAIFLAPPDFEYFHLIAERPILVSFKEFPQLPHDILEWERRLLLLNGNKKFTERGFKAAAIVGKNFHNLTLEQLLNIKKEYNVKYYLSKTSDRKNLVRLFGNNYWSLYEIKDK